MLECHVCFYFHLVGLPHPHGAMAVYRVRDGRGPFGVATDIYVHTVYDKNISSIFRILDQKGQNPVDPQISSDELPTRAFVQFRAPSFTHQHTAIAATINNAKLGQKLGTFHILGKCLNGFSGDCPSISSVPATFENQQLLAAPCCKSLCWQQLTKLLPGSTGWQRGPRHRWRCGLKYKKVFSCW